MLPSNFASSSPNDDLLFLNWLNDNGCDVSMLSYPCYNEMGVRCVKAKTQISSNVPFLKISNRVMMTVEKARVDSEIGEALNSHNFFLNNDFVTLAVFLYYEIKKQQHSFYFPYLRVLPKTIGNLAVTWTGNELKELQDEFIVSKMLEEKNNRFNYYLKAKKIIFDCFAKDEVKRNSFDNYQLFDYCLLVVDSRAFGKRFKHAALVPFADALNHGPVSIKYEMVPGSNNVKNSNNEKQNHNERSSSDYFVFYYTARQQTPVEPEEEVFNSYGRLSNEDLLLNYGFTLSEENKFDSLLTTFTITEGRWSFANLKIDVLQKCNLNHPLVLKFHHFFYEVDVVLLLKFFRLTEIKNAKEFKSFEEQSQKKSSYNLVLQLPLSWENELAAVRGVIKEVSYVLSNAFATTYEFDCSELRKPSLPLNYWFALKYRISRKGILQKLVLFFQDYLRLLVLRKNQIQIDDGIALHELCDDCWKEARRNIYKTKEDALPPSPPPPLKQY